MIDCSRTVPPPLLACDRLPGKSGHNLFDPNVASVYSLVKRDRHFSINSTSDDKDPFMLNRSRAPSARQAFPRHISRSDLLEKSPLEPLSADLRFRWEEPYDLRTPKNEPRRRWPLRRWERFRSEH